MKVFQLPRCLCVLAWLLGFQPGADKPSPPLERRMKPIE
jgi:hypothetical protein